MLRKRFAGQKTNVTDQVCRLRNRLLRGALTVECAMVLPIFFMVCLTVISFMNGIRLQAEKNLALSNKARGMAVVGNLGGDLFGDSMDDIWIDLPLTTTFEYPFALPGMRNLRIAIRARVYPWIGSADGIGSGEHAGAGADDTIYLSDTGSVYHTHSDCSHINLTIIKTDQRGLETLRNASGEKYKKCRGFPDDYDGPVYVTLHGEYYYPSTDYGSLTRHVHVAKRSDHGDLKLCERCAARDRKEGYLED